MTTNDDLHITEPETAERITRWTHGQVQPRPWTHRAAVYQGCICLGSVWRLPDGQWTTWRDGARHQTAEEAAEELRQQHHAAQRDTETTEDICPEQMQRRVRRVAAERRAR